MQIKGLECMVKEVRRERDRILEEKCALEIEMREESGEVGKPKRRRRWVRAVLRPWTLLRRRNVDTK